MHCVSAQNTGFTRRHATESQHSSPHSRFSRQPNQYTYLNRGIPIHSPNAIFKKIIIPQDLHQQGRSGFLAYFDDAAVLKNILYRRQEFNNVFKRETGQDFHATVREKRNFIQSWQQQDLVSEQAVQALDWILNLPDKSVQSSPFLEEAPYCVIDTQPYTHLGHATTKALSISDNTSSTEAAGSRKRTLSSLRENLPVLEIPVPIAQFTPASRPWKNGASTETHASSLHPMQHQVTSHKISVPRDQMSTFTTTHYQQLQGLIEAGLPIQETKDFLGDLFRYNDLDNRKVFTEFSKQTENTLFVRNEDGRYAFQASENSPKGYAVLNIFIAILGHKTDPVERNELGVLLAELIKHTTPSITQTYDGDGDLPLHAFCKLLLETPLPEAVSQSILKAFYEHKSVNGGIFMFCQKTAPLTEPNGVTKSESIIDILSETHEDYAGSSESRASVLKHLLEHLGRENALLLLSESGYSSSEKMASLTPTHPGTPILKAAISALHPQACGGSTPPPLSLRMPAHYPRLQMTQGGKDVSQQPIPKKSRASARPYPRLGGDEALQRYNSR